MAKLKGIETIEDLGRKWERSRKRERDGTKRTGRFVVVLKARI